MRKQLMKGNEAIVKSAILAGCRAFYGYPITPASEIAEAAAELMPKTGGVYVQAESEVASVNMLYGAASAGVRAMTASSGPGISLMQEGISYMAGAGCLRHRRHHAQHILLADPTQQPIPAAAGLCGAGPCGSVPFRCGPASGSGRWIGGATRLRLRAVAGGGADQDLADFCVPQCLALQSRNDFAALFQVRHDACL